MQDALRAVSKQWSCDFAPGGNAEWTADTLTHLKLASIDVTPVAPSLAHLPALSDLVVTLNSKRATAAPALARALPAVTSLRTFACAGLTGDLAAGLVPSLAELPSLAAVALGCKVFDPEHARAISRGLGGLRTLTHLHLTLQLAHESTFAPFAAAPAPLSRLRSLSFRVNGMGGGGDTLAATLSALPALSILDLHGVRAFADGSTAVAEAVGGLSSLVELAMRFCNCGPAGAPALAAALGRLTALHRISLECSAINDAALGTLAPALAPLTALTMLNLDGNKISSGGARTLAAAVPALSQLTVSAAETGLSWNVRKALVRLLAESSQLPL